VAIQNFISGGFYGKLGDVVGQRWRNIRTVRTHVIPFNPKTEKQQANRQQFALATSLAQQAFNINRGWQIWQRPDMGQFSFMVSVAKRRLQAGMSPAEALPLYPPNYNPSVVIRNAVTDFSEWHILLTIRDSTYVMPDTRQIEIITNCYDMMSDQWVLVKRVEYVNKDIPFTLHFDTEGRYALPPGSSIQAVSIDDSQFGDVSISLPVMQIVQPSKIHCTIEIEDWYIDRADYPEHLNFHSAIPFPQLFDDIILSVRLYNTSANVWETVGIVFMSEIEFELWGKVALSTADYSAPVGSNILRQTITLPEQEYAYFTLEIYRFDFSSV